MQSLILLAVPFIALIFHLSKDDLKSKKRYAALQGGLSIFCLGCFMSMAMDGSIPITDEARQLYFPNLVFCCMGIHGLMSWLRYNKLDQNNKNNKNSKSSKGQKKTEKH